MLIPTGNRTISNLDDIKKKAHRVTVGCSSLMKSSLDKIRVPNLIAGVQGCGY